MRADGSVVEKPVELASAEMLDSLAHRYGTLPWPGALFEQPAIAFMHWQNTLALGRTDSSAAPQSAQEQLLASLPLEALLG